MKKALLFVLCMVLFWGIKSQNISGTVYDTKYDRPVEMAHVVVAGTNTGSFTDENGNFEIPNVPEGNVVIHASLVGYKPHEKELVIDNEGIADLKIYLQPSNISLNNAIVITARRIESSAFSSPEALTIINSQQLKRESPRTVPEALTGHTGVFTQKTNHGGGSPFIRGLTGNQNLMMIDGIRLNNATFRYGPNQYLNTIDPYAVQQMEIVRGAGSVLYGSDAMGGVINVLTRDPNYSAGFKAGGAVYGKWMSEDMEKTGRGEVRLSNNSVAFLGGFTYNDFGNIVGGDTTGKQPFTGYSEYAADAKLRVKLSDSKELIMAYQYDKQRDVPRTDKLMNNYVQYHFDPQIRQLGYVRLKSNSKNKWTKQLTVTGSFGQSDESRIKQKEGSSKVEYENDLVNTWGATAEVTSIPGRNWHFQTGLEFYFDKVNSDKSEQEDGQTTPKRGYYPDGATSTSYALYSTHTFNFQPFSLVAGTRLNMCQIKAKDDIFGDVDVSPVALVGSLSAIYHAGGHVNLIASVYNAFRAPNLNDLSSFGTFNAGIEVPNPDLDPERSVNTEIGVKVRVEKFSGSFFVYRNQLTDLIERVEATWQGQDSIDGEKVYKKENFAKAYIRGFEVGAEYEFIPGLSASGNVTYTYGQNESQDEPMRRIPPLFGKLGVHYRHVSGFWSTLEWLSAGKQDRLSGGDERDSRIPEGGTPGWSVFNLRAGYTWKWVGLTAGLNNILDEDYRMHGSGVNGVGRSAWLALQVKF